MKRNKRLTLLSVFPLADKFEDKEVASSIKKDLRNMGHDISQRPALTDVNGLSYFKENVSAHADSRRGGEGSAQF